MSREELQKRILEVRYNLVSAKDKEFIDVLEKLAIKALTATYPYERVIVKRSDGGELEAIYDVSRELLILGYVTSELARDLGWTWEIIKEHEELEGALGGIEPVTRMESEE